MVNTVRFSGCIDYRYTHTTRFPHAARFPQYSNVWHKLLHQSYQMYSCVQPVLSITISTGAAGISAQLRLSPKDTPDIRYRVLHVCYHNFVNTCSNQLLKYARMFYATRR